MTDRADADPGSTWAGEAGAEQLYAQVRAACAGGGEDLPSRLEGGLRAALELLAAQPELAYVLTVDPYLGAEEGALVGLREWFARFGNLLDEAAGADPHASQEPPFLAPSLIGGVRFQIARLVLRDEAADLGRLLPTLLEALLAYYFEPGEPRALADTALARRPA